MAEKREFRFVRFYTVTPDLHLRISPPEMFETAVGRQPPPFPRTKKTIGRRVRIRAVRGSGKIRLLPIAGREIPTSDCDFADMVETQLITGFIKEKNIHVLHGIAYRDHSSDR
jgi:hypothetical protein